MRVLPPRCSCSWRGLPVAAQPPAGVGPVRAVRLTSPVTVDGRLDEPAWQGPPPYGG